MAERSPEIEQRIIEGLSAGTPLAVLCREDGMPSDRAVRYWQEEDEAFASAIARARLDGFDAIAWRARMTARSKTEDDGGDSSGDVQRDKLIIETDLKLLAKWDPKRYGDLLKHSGPDGSSPIASVQITAEMTPQQAAEA
jgi:hypothetical protein